MLKRGCRGDDVRRIQEALSKAGLGLVSDGVFGYLTEEAVKEFQRMKGLVVDGIVGPDTERALLAARLSITKSRRSIDGIVIHCTATRPNQDLTAADIRRMHKAQGWADIGYHYVIRHDGTIEQGRDVDKMGAHVSGYNAHTIGVVYVGGLNAQGKAADTRTENQKQALIQLLKQLRAVYPKATIKGHRDYSPDKNNNGTIEPCEWIKMCPCFDASEYKYI